MSLNFQNILTESIVDDLKISKLDKVALKVFNIIKDEWSISSDTSINYITKSIKI